MLAEVLSLATFLVYHLDMVHRELHLPVFRDPRFLLLAAVIGVTCTQTVTPRTPCRETASTSQKESEYRKLCLTIVSRATLAGKVLESGSLWPGVLYHGVSVWVWKTLLSCGRI